jgi:hypothetical protein
MSTSVNVNEPLSPQDRTRGLAEGGTIPAATACHSVLIEPGGVIPLISPPHIVYTFGGNTADFDVAYDTTLRSEGQALADAILGRCEQDLSQLRFFSEASAQADLASSSTQEPLAHTTSVARAQRSTALLTTEWMVTWRIS